MRRSLLVLGPWMVMTAAVAAPPQPASLRYTYLPEFTAGVFRVADECFVALSELDNLGWRVNLQGEDANIMADGRQLRVPVKFVEDRKCIPLKVALEQLGAVSEWSDDSTMRVWSEVRAISLDAENITIDTTLTTSASSFILGNPARLVVDLKGARIGARQIESPAGVRASQYQSDVVRVVLERGDVAQARTGRALPSRSITVALTPSRELEPGPATQQTSDPASYVSPAVEPAPPPPPTSTIGPLAIISASETDVTVSLPVSGKLDKRPTAQYLGPTTIEMRIANAKPADSGFADARHAFLVGSSYIVEPDNTVKLTLNLSRPLAFELKTNDMGISLRLIMPRTGFARLAGQIIVVDAGHGGHDQGASAKGVKEKDLTLKLARLVASELIDEGASVIMTRADDTFVPLKERPEIANKSGAALFVSIHINSNKVANSRSGGITFYHKQDSMSALFAECVQSELAKAGKIPSIGIWSDGRIYESGFAVLRGASMPAVLIELGFINHARDLSELVSAKFQNSAAKAIVRGIKVYLGDGQKEESRKQ